MDEQTFSARITFFWEKLHTLFFFLCGWQFAFDYTFCGWMDGWMDGWMGAVRIE
jgi:hypothetical protein